MSRLEEIETQRHRGHRELAMKGIGKPERATQDNVMSRQIRPLLPATSVLSVPPCFGKRSPSWIWSSAIEAILPLKSTSDRG